jgi:acetylornithine deacetylase/succinyl-diaminopimelate desuccinylase-like protein
VKNRTDPSWGAGLPGGIRAAFDQAASLVTEDRVAEIVTQFVDVPSPTGQERPLAERIARLLEERGLDGRVMAIDDDQANAWGRLRGQDSNGAKLMLYAPIDTVTSGDAADDVPVVGSITPDLLPRAYRPRPSLLAGLGASNPKGHAACMLAAAEAIRLADVPLLGDLLVAFGAGGMPTNAPKGASRRNLGHGVGAAFLIEQGVWPDVAVIAKPGWSVTWEEVGITWFDITVHGDHSYVAARHRLPYDNSIRSAARLVEELEEWFPAYSAAHTGGGVAPQAVVGSISGGWERSRSFIPATTVVRVDLRISPRTTPAMAERELRAEVHRIASALGIRADVELVLSLPGAATSEDAWITRSSVAAWEAMEGRTHVPERALSGLTDANLFRRAGIPTARVGMPKVVEAGREVGFEYGMNCIDLEQAVRFTRLLVRIALDTTMRQHTELESQ